MKIQKLLGLCLILTVLFSLTSPIKKSPAKNNLLKSITVSGEITTKYIYDDKAQLLDVESAHGYTKYSYDENGRLIREDYAMDPNATSSSVSFSPAVKKEMMTARNSTITSYDLFEYDKENRIKKIKHYSKKNRHIEFASITNFIYKGDYVVQRNLTDIKGEVVYSFNTYTYDMNGNTINEKYYAISSPSYYLPKLISETRFRFDDKPSYNSFYKMLGRPGYNTNPNNVIETSFILYDEHAKNNPPIITKSYFTYNANGFPATEKKEGIIFEFHYAK